MMATSMAGAQVMIGHADAATSYQGGCTVAYTATAPSQCTYASTGSPEVLVFEGTGSAVVGGCQPTTSYPPGRFTLSGQQAGATCTVAINGAGAAMAVDSTATDYANECVGFDIGGGSASCHYVALSASGLAQAALLSAFTTTVTMTVVDNTAGGASVATCSTSGMGLVPLECPFGEAPAHAYSVAVTSTPSAQAVVLLADG